MLQREPDREGLGRGHQLAYIAVYVFLAEQALDDRGARGRRAEAFLAHGLAQLVVLQQLARGMQQKAIATSLSLSVETVRTHIRNIYEKLQVHNKTEAIKKAYRN